MSEAESVQSVVKRLVEDWQWARRHTWFSTVVGAVWLPRIVRRLLFALSGASVRSAPGMSFIFAGSARNLTIERGVYMNRGVSIEAVAPVVIGADCALGMEAMIITSHHAVDPVSGWELEATGRPVSIGDRVWIGARAVILPGSIIESDVVIAAGAVVTGRCLSRGIYGGVPAKRIRDYDDMGRSAGIMSREEPAESIAIE